MRRARSALAAWLAGAHFVCAEPVLEWVRSDGRLQIEVSGLHAAELETVRDWPAEKWSALFDVRVLQEGAPPMLGAWRSEGGLLRFTPRFPIMPGVAYRATFAPARLPGAATDAPQVISDFTMPAPAQKPTTVVTRVFPSADEVPENLLKFYLHFSAPMSRGRIYEHIHLRDETGKEIELPFLELDEELWDPEMKRLTLFIDPGRIKRGVRPREEIGPALQRGRRYSLAIDAAWRDSAGQPLARNYAHAFRVGPPARAPIDPGAWKISAPKSGEAGALRVTFPAPMDHALALRLLRVTDAGGAAVTGTPELADAERVWTFTPALPWSRGDYQLVVPETLEDLAGNNVGKAFDVDVIEDGARRAIAKEITLRFAVK